MVVQFNGVKFNSSSDFNGLKKPVESYFVVPNDVADIFEKENSAEEKTKKKKNKVIKIIGITLASLIGAVGCVRVMPKSVVNKFNKLMDYLLSKSEKVTTSSKTAIFYRKIISKMRNMAEKSRGFNNFVSFKDIWFQRRITDRVPILKKICNKTTSVFDSIGRRVVRKTYKRSLKKFDKLNLLYTNTENELLKDASTVVEINGIKKTKAEWVKELSVKREKLLEILENDFSENSINGRNKRMKSFMSDLGDKVWASSFGKKGSFRKKDTYLTFWADKFLASDKSKFSDEINKMRVSVKFGRKDKARSSDTILQSCKRFIHPQDIASEKSIREISKLLNEYKKAVDKNPERAKEILNNVIQKTNDFVKIINHGKDTFKYDEHILNALETRSAKIKSVLTSTDRGYIDEINEIYRGLVSEKEHKYLKQVSKNAVYSLDNAIKKETNDYFDKLRDWTLGAAPTDILGVLGGFASMGGALALTSDKEKRKSIILKAGIPALGGAGVMMYMTAMLTSGAKGLAAGLLSSFILNKIGAFVDNKRKSFNSNKLT